MTTYSHQPPNLMTSHSIQFYKRHSFLKTSLHVILSKLRHVIFFGVWTVEEETTLINHEPYKLHRSYSPSIIYTSSHLHHHHHYSSHHHYTSRQVILLSLGVTWKCVLWYFFLLYFIFSIICYVCLWYYVHDNKRKKKERACPRRTNNGIFFVFE